MKHHTQKKGKQVAIPKRIDSRSLAVSGHLSAINPEVITTIIPNDFFSEAFQSRAIIFGEYFFGGLQAHKKHKTFAWSCRGRRYSMFFLCPTGWGPQDIVQLTYKWFTYGLWQI